GEAEEEGKGRRGVRIASAWDGAGRPSSTRPPLLTSAPSVRFRRSNAQKIRISDGLPAPPLFSAPQTLRLSDSPLRPAPPARRPAGYFRCWRKRASVRFQASAAPALLYASGRSSLKNAWSTPG